MIATCSLLVALSLNQTPAASQVGHLSGRVTLAGANSPISDARVMLTPAGRPTGPMGPPPQTLTDRDGRFTFDQLPPGEYRLNVQKAGFAPPDEVSTARPITIAAGQSLDVILQMQKGAAITGKVLDPRGEPFTEAIIMVLRRMPLPPGGGRGLPAGPRLIPAPSNGAQTNDLGEFRVSGVAPGEYYVAARPRPIAMFGTAGSSPVRDRKEARSTLPTTYYPGTSDQAAAQPIAVAAGAEVGNIIFTMQSVPAFRVSGVVVDEDGKPAGDAMVMLTGDPRTGAMGPAGSAMSRADGQFDIADVPAGTYHINASIVIRMSGSAGAGGRGVVSSGVVSGGGGSSVSSGGGSTYWSNSASGGRVDPPAEISVTDADVTGVRVVTRRPNPR